jgi:hypothetical protein
MYQLRISLDGIAPPVWRQVIVPASATLRRLHGVIQTSMGWTNSHLHVFEFDGRRLGRPDPHGMEYLEGEDGPKTARCIAGGRACPPEDCGGLPGYEQLLEAILDPFHPEHREMRDWLGRDFHPDAFDLAEADRRTSRGR